MNDSTDRRYGRKELRLFCYHKILILPVKWYNVIRKLAWYGCKCILQTQRQALKKSSKRRVTDILQEEKVGLYKMLD